MSLANGESDVRIGLIGCGRVAEFGYLPAFRQARGVVLVGIADVNPSRCRALAPGVPAYGNIQSLIQAGGLDAIVISVPTRFHLEYARCAAEAGFPSLVEKPPGANVQEAKALQAAFWTSTPSVKSCPTAIHSCWWTASRNWKRNASSASRT